MLTRTSPTLLLVTLSTAVALAVGSDPVSRRLERDRLRSARKQIIKNYIETAFNWKDRASQQANRDDSAVATNNNDNMNYLNNLQVNRYRSGQPIDYTERIQSHYPECEIDDRYLLQLPASPNVETLIFKPSFPEPASGNKIGIVEAKLRMFQKPLASSNSDPSSALPPCPEENKLRITVSWLKLKNHGLTVPESVLLDSIMVPTSQSGWISLDITGAVRSWHEHPHKASAVTVEIEDNGRRPVQLKSVLQPLNCSAVAESNLSPLSSVGAGPSPVPLLPGGPRFVLNGIMHPLVDITTVQIPLDGDHGKKAQDTMDLYRKNAHNTAALHNNNNNNMNNDNVRTPFSSTDYDDDYLLPVGVTSHPRRDNPADRLSYRGKQRDREPVVQRIVLTRDQLLRQLGQLDQQSKDLRDREMETLRQIVAKIIRDNEYN